MTRPNPPTALIADDEALLAADLKARIETAWPELRIVAVCRDGIEALECLQAQRPGIAFLDIRMPGMSGLEVAAQIDFPCRVVFVTAYEQYAIEAFEQAAVDYLLKPVDDQRLLKTLERLRQPDPPAAVRAEQISDRATGADDAPLRWIRALVGDEVRMVSVDEVLYFQALDKYTLVVSAAQQMLIRTSIRELLTKLDPDRFWQVHRGTIVNLAFVRAARQDAHGHMSLSLAGTDQRLAVSRGFAGRFRQM